MLNLIKSPRLRLLKWVYAQYSRRVNVLITLGSITLREEYISSLEILFNIGNRCCRQSVPDVPVRARYRPLPPRTPPPPRQRVSSISPARPAMRITAKYAYNGTTTGQLYTQNRISSDQHARDKWTVNRVRNANSSPLRLSVYMYTYT